MWFSVLAEHPGIELLGTYAPQKSMEIADTVAPGETIDLSSEYDIKGTITEYAWYLTEDIVFVAEDPEFPEMGMEQIKEGAVPVVPAEASEGVFSFGEEHLGKTLRCTMTNTLYPELTLMTTEVTVDDGKLEIEDETGSIIDAIPDEDITFEDEDGKEIPAGMVRLIVGNVAENNKKDVREAIEAYKKEFEATDDNHAMYDFSLESDKGVKVKIVDGRIYIGLKYPGNTGSNSTDYTFNLYHIKADGTVEEIAVETKPDGIWFYADDFSPYVLTYELKQQTPSGGSGGSGSDDDDDSTGGEGGTGGGGTGGGGTSGKGDTPGTGDVTAQNTAGIILAGNLALLAYSAIAVVMVFRRERAAAAVQEAAADSAEEN